MQRLESSWGISLEPWGNLVPSLHAHAESGLKASLGTGLGAGSSLVFMHMQSLDSRLALGQALGQALGRPWGCYIYGWVILRNFTSLHNLIVHVRTSLRVREGTQLAK